MRVALIILVVFLIEKDLLFAPYPNVLRVAAQCLCLFVGLLSLLSSLPHSLWARYWPVLGYLLVLLLTVPLSDFPLFVLLQFISLASIIVFAIAYFDTQPSPGTLATRTLVLTMVVMYGAAMLASLILVKLNPTAAYESQFLGNMAGYELRFRGMFSKAGMMGAAAGLLVGMSGIAVRRPAIKVPLLILGLVCLLLTQSRTFWIAALIAGAVTIWFYYPRMRRAAIGAALTGMLALVIAYAFSVRVDAKKAEHFARFETITTLTGRTALWADALIGLKERPLLGYGFTLGASGLPGNRPTAATNARIDPTQLSRQTLHNGYVQCAMDAGLVGLFFYSMTMVLAIKRQLTHDVNRDFPEVTYALLFLCIANFGESVIYSGAVFQSLCFWIFAAFALGRVQHSQVNLAAASAWSKAVVPRPANLMR